jgi:hypothetical protein
LEKLSETPLSIPVKSSAEILATVAKLDQKRAHAAEVMQGLFGIERGAQSIHDFGCN